MTLNIGWPDKLSPVYDQFVVTTAQDGGTLLDNVADAGGVSCALQITQALPDGDLEEFFESYAAIWRSNAPNEYINMVYLTDVHSPGKLRVNVQLGNCDTFYEMHGIQEGDGMYIAPEQRVSIW